MSDAPFTPAPWVIHPPTASNNIPIRDAEGGIIAEVWGCDAEARGNAALIAAAVNATLTEHDSGEA